MNKIILLSLFVLSAACNPFGSQSKLGNEFHPGAQSSGTSATPSSTSSFGDLQGFKHSPGAQKSTGTSLAMDAYVTPTNVKMVGTSAVSGDFTINNSDPR